MTTDYVAPAPMGAWVEGCADVIRATKSLVFLQGTATVEGETILRFSGVYKIGPKRDYANPRDPFGLLTETPARKK
jgi:acyl-coenzyme A thioesterase PaaI-like protein